MRPDTRLSPLIAGLAILAGCSHQTSSPTGATLQVTLDSPYSDDGALFFTVTGGRVDSLDAAGYTVYLHRADQNTLQVILTGDLAAGPVARLWVPDERQVSQYTVTVDQVAARSTYEERDPQSYRVSLQQ